MSLCVRALNSATLSELFVFFLLHKVQLSSKLVALIFENF
jgi:hypothetical protein